MILVFFKTICSVLNDYFILNFKFQFYSFWNFLSEICSLLFVLLLQVDWYNNLVAPKYKLDYKNDTVALIFFTIPYVFNESFIPFLCDYKEMVVHKSWEKFIHYNMEKVQQKLKEDYHLVMSQYTFFTFVNIVCVCVLKFGIFIREDWSV